MDSIKAQLLNFKLHFIVIVLTVIAEMIGVIKIPIGASSIVLLPLFYSFVIGILINPNVIKKASSLITIKQAEKATPIILIAVMPFLAKFGTLIGPSLDKILSVGPAMIFQELGNLGTILIAMPVAVLLLKMGRESVGACFSIAREPNIALISDKYGLKNPEGIGVMGVYVMGTMFGTLYFAILASVLASLNLFDIKALAMACGVGSGSMTAACSASLGEMYPSLKDEILALAGASNLLTNATGLFLGLFVALPLTEKLYKVLTKKKDEKVKAELGSDSNV
ncbi:DUF3100 domain-containing protein [Photobacterium sanctipauli]|uniref:DUF3100 domain-containing protein n=1 Tax=Photobacterium sanctipauli TaxID=1342794 RepID=A0A2T3NVL5_9GAMM|nr:DUF3100 domain-containing protein [Photobacterium sanctipauli]PSW20320.1 DUF3100 domain-containing protein [Photobacterium sanctipauli]